MNPILKVTVGGAAEENAVHQALKALESHKVLVGIPETDALERKRQVLSVAMKSKGKRRKRLEKMALESAINNAQLLFIHTNGSPLKHIPARPVIEPAITDPDNKEKITDEFGKAMRAALDGKPELVVQQLNRAGQLAENYCRQWFTDSRNHWTPNAPSTIRRKKSSRPLIDTASMRKAITHLVSDSQ